MDSPGPDESATAQQDWATGEWGGDAEHQNIEHSEHDAATAYDPASKPAESSPSDSASNDEDEEEEEEDEDEEEDGGGEYDPESASYDPAFAPTNDTNLPDAPARNAASTATSDARPAKKPKTAGGFIVGSSDDEDEDDSTPAPQPLAAATSLTREPSPASALSQKPAASINVLPSAQSSAGTAPAMSGRLHSDTIGLLEDRVKEDPRGDVDAWRSLIQEQRRRNKIEDAREVYERFFVVFPQAAEMWLEYLAMELSLDNFQQAEAIFGRTLLSVPHVDLWTAYLNYIRRRHDLNDPTGQARQVVSTSYEFVLKHIGQDRDAGQIWSDYIQFLKSGPGQVGGSSWQDQQKMDILRKAYQRAICVPMPNLNALWKEYNQFELGLNKTAGQKFLQERSPSYMTARTANTHLENLTRGLQRATVPRLPPAPGFDGDAEYQEQIALWKAWIAWEKDDPLVLQQDDPATYQQRIQHVYKQALMALRFWPELWVEAAEWCFEQNLTDDKGDAGTQFLVDGVTANTESPLLALKHADRIESTHQVSEGDEGKAALAQAVRAPYDQAFDTLYEMIKKLKDRETLAITRAREDPTLGAEEDEGEINEDVPGPSVRQERIKALQAGFAAQIQLISQQISYLWIALARAFRRIQGQGKTATGKPTAGIRAIFTESRSRGRLTSDVYVAIANMEWDIYQDPVATKIFERGAKLFPEEERFIVEYLKHLHARHDFTNARVVFSQTVKRFKDKAKDSPEMLAKLKPLYTYFHSYEAKFGELAQIKQLEQEMTELFPFDPSLSHFAARFSTERFNPISTRVIVSPGAQMRPKALIMQSVEQPIASIPDSPAPVAYNEPSPRPQFLQPTHSPKRPYQADEEEYNPPRKMARGVSPLKGAAGRRLDQQRRAQGGASSQAATPLPIPRDITFLLSLIPPASTFTAPRFSPDGMVRLIANTAVPDYRDWQSMQARNARTESTSRAHTRQASSEYPAYAQQNRESPVPASASGRPISPFGGARGAQISAPYRNSPLRPGSSGEYEAAQASAAYQAPGPSLFNPANQTQPLPNAQYWQGAAYGQQPPNPYGQPPQQYGGGWQ
ncbi:cleavage stimulation factor subunit 3 [Microdochium nivale]|nr:cleavage stimulation factor subunit 3 [Microdochium nivale]